MSLTGTPFFVIAICLLVIAFVLPLAFWSRLRGPAAVRGLVRLLMLLFAQLTAITVVFVAVNNANGLYDTWEDLLGTGDHAGVAADLGPDGTGGRKLSEQPKEAAVFRPVDDPKVGEGVRVTDLKGRISGVEGEVYVWLPPQYDDPAHRDKKFPVVQLLPGYPGSAKAWFGALQVNKQLKPLMQQGKVKPFILVSPRTTLLGDQTDTGCANTPGKVNADTWLSVDVRRMVTDTFRASDRAADWAVGGYSAGAHCAAKLAIAHPDRYRAGVSLSGFNDPNGEPAALTAATPELRRANNPYFMLKNANDAGKPPHTALFLSGAAGDGFEAAGALKGAARKPTTVRVVKTVGPHGTSVWKTQVPEVFRWLSEQLGK
ncbi:alpha/beta hydrolase [Streptomyces sp. NPDC088745]|uniref:alpha/beta hydrolase n=1 Tax=Streptomyces sp. NPDC088745 TaxID=3365884 RepID=UPI003829B30A